MGLFLELLKSRITREPSDIVGGELNYESSDFCVIKEGEAHRKLTDFSDNRRKDLFQVGLLRFVFNTGLAGRWGVKVMLSREEHWQELVTWKPRAEDPFERFDTLPFRDSNDDIHLTRGGIEVVLSAKDNFVEITAGEQTIMITYDPDNNLS